MSRSRIVELLLLAGILAGAGYLRYAQRDTFIASDELRWTCRSVNFLTSLERGDPAGTFQVGHPGVLTMWSGAAALAGTPRGRWDELCRTTDGGRDLSKLDDVGQEGVLQTITPILLAARRGASALGLILLALVYAALRLGAVTPLAALTAVGLLAFDPFLLAHNRVLHTDALASLAALLAVVGFSAQQLRRHDRARFAALAGLPAGLALVAKSSTLVLVPFVALFLGARVAVASSARREAARAALRDGVGWIVGATLAALVVWPALWTAPLATAMGVLTKAQEEGGAPHPGGNFFLGQPVADPGPLFYPVAGLFRVTPVATLAIIAAALIAARWLWLRARKQQGMKWLAQPSAVQICALVAWAVLFAGALTLGPKKFDRYALPSLAALNVAGGLAVAALASRVSPSDPKPNTSRAHWVGPAICLSAVLLQAFAAARSIPYGLAYFNPLAGGPQVARRALLVGWGEGYNLAADYLNGLPGADKLEVAVPGVANFAPLFVGRTRSAEGYREGRTDYAVLYISKVQRRRNEDLLDSFVGRKPQWTGGIAGLPYVAVYPNRTLAAVDGTLAQRLEDGDVLIADGETAFAKRADRGEMPPRLAGTKLVRTWGHWGAPEIQDAFDDELADGFKRAWVIRYPQHDPDAVLGVMGGAARLVETIPLLDGAVELSLFEKREEP